MNRHRTTTFAAAVFIAGMAGGSPVAFAQVFQNYKCADGTRFIAGFYSHDPRAYLQIDGGAVTLARRPTLSGSRYAGRGVTLKITKNREITLKHARRPVTECELI